MSGRAAFVLAVTVLIALGALAAYLIGIPIWAVLGGAALVFGTFLRAVKRRFDRHPLRQNTEG